MIKILILVLLSSTVFSDGPVTCDGDTIEFCTNCNSEKEGKDPDSCASCENKHFPFFFDLICLACNDPNFGQIGCIGNCDGSNFLETRQITCEKDKCKEGYYYDDGQCIQCDQYNHGCIKCSYKKEENETDFNFICTECENTTKYFLKDGICEECNIPGCVSCHYLENGEQECNICDSYYFKNSNGTCQGCEYVNIDNGGCVFCANQTDYLECDCNYGSIEVDNKCLKCPSNCYGNKYCKYNSTLKKTQCSYCDYSYVSNSDLTECLPCRDNCKSCEFDEKNNQICLDCSYGYQLIEGKCFELPSGCSNVKLNETSEYKNETICTKCSSSYVLNPINNSCISCSRYGCDRCNYTNEDNIECRSCVDERFVFVHNTHQCLLNNIQEQICRYGCLNATYDKNAEEYKCSKCKSSYIFISNYSSCIPYYGSGLSDECLEAININTTENPLYSCTNCPASNTQVIDLSKGGIIDCRSKYGNFLFCLEGIIEENENEKCTLCEQSATLNVTLNKCVSYFGFYEYNYECNKRDEGYSGDIGCDSSKGCYYNSLTDNFICNECKEGYYKNEIGKCISCEENSAGCKKCHFDSITKEAKCDSCKSMYTLDQNKTCTLEECKEYPEISSGCMICKNKLSEYKNNNKCEYCKYGYFKTKEEKCVYCRSEEYGGPACYECGYEQDENGNETNNIICKDCYSYNNYHGDKNSIIENADYFISAFL